MRTLPFACAVDVLRIWNQLASGLLPNTRIDNYALLHSSLRPALPAGHLGSLYIGEALRCHHDLHPLRRVLLPLPGFLTDRWLHFVPFQSPMMSMAYMYFMVRYCSHMVLGSGDAPRLFLCRWRPEIITHQRYRYAGACQLACGACAFLVTALADRGLLQSTRVHESPKAATC